MGGLAPTMENPMDNEMEIEWFSDKEGNVFKNSGLGLKV